MSQNNHKPNPHIIQRKARYQYIPVQETLESEELGKYTTFGLSVRTVETEIAFVSDVSTEFEEIERLADICTEKQLDPEHLQDVLEDFLVEGTLISN